MYLPGAGAARALAAVDGVLGLSHMKPGYKLAPSLLAGPARIVRAAGACHVSATLLPGGGGGAGPADYLAEALGKSGLGSLAGASSAYAPRPRLASMSDEGLD